MRIDSPVFQRGVALATGILIGALVIPFGELGLFGILLWGIFFIPKAYRIAKQKRMPDEREIQLTNKANTGSYCALMMTMGAIYYFIPTLNWWHWLIATSFFYDGLFGLIIFTKE